MSGKKRPRLSVPAIMLPFLAGLVIGYAGHGLVAPGSQNSDSGGSGDVVRIDPSRQAESSGAERQVASKTEAMQPKVARVGRPPRHQPVETFERFSDATTSIRDLHQSPLDPGPGRGHDAHLAAPDDVALVGGADAWLDQEHLDQLERIAEWESQNNPPTLEPDEGDLENPYLYDGLPEVAEWEELEAIEDDQWAQAQDESEDPVSFEEEPLPPLTE